jgi:hypothetical protein
MSQLLANSCALIGSGGRSGSAPEDPMANQDRSRGKRPALGALLIAAVVTGASYAAGNPNAKEFASLPSDIGAPFLRASLDETSLKVLAMPTPKVPTEKYNLADTPYKTDPPELARFLVLEGTTGPVTPKEIRGLERYLLEYPLPKCNTINYYFRKHYIPWLLEWVYERTRNPALLEKAIRLAYSAAAHRNDRFGAENIGNEGPVAMWPHYREKNEWRNGKLVLHGDSAHFCGLSFQAVPARMIARHPMCWDRTLEGVTYKQIAFDLVRESMKSTEFMNRVVRDPETNLLIGPSLWESSPNTPRHWTPSTQLC